MNDAQLFAFEDDFVTSLRCILMAVRLKLNRSGIKLTLRQWSRLTRDERQALLDAPCRSVREVPAYHERLVALVALRAKPLADPPAPIWESALAPPPVLVAPIRRRRHHAFGTNEIGLLRHRSAAVAEWARAAQVRHGSRPCKKPPCPRRRRRGVLSSLDWLRTLHLPISG